VIRFEAGFVTGLMIYITITGIIYAIQATERLRAEEARVTQLENLRTRAELQALRSQLNPHFLFNTLHSLMALVRRDPSALEDALERLAGLLRHTLMTIRDTDDVALSDELDFIENYLDLERLRLGERLRVQQMIQRETLRCAVPPFALQPLIKNSIKHAIGRQAHGGLLTIRAERHDGLLKLEVSDDGAGANPDELVTSTGSGLRIARERLMTRYKDGASFRVSTGPGQGFSVRMEMPARETASALA
jgi:sensor histidine kinase YesM